MHFFLYRLLTMVLSPLVLGHISWKAWSNRDSRYFKQRLGFGFRYGFDKPATWFHCASVGEVNTLLPLLRHLLEQAPGRHYIITTNTVTGASIVDRFVGSHHAGQVQHCYLPFDWSFSIRAFLKRARPAKLVILETEIWPNLIRHCQKQGISVQIINARLSSKTMNARKWIKSVLAHSLKQVDLVACRSEQDAASWRALAGEAGSGPGKNPVKNPANKPATNNSVAASDIVKACGNLKLTTVLHDRLDDTASFNMDRPYVLLASTHHDEEQQFYKSWLLARQNDCLVIAPRHPERADSIIKQLREFKADLKLARRSKDERIENDTEVFLLDTVGELKNYFANARLVIMGGSFVPVGGHNILEPASHHAPVITGPYMENFVDELKLMLEHDAIIQLNGMQDMTPTLGLLNSSRCQQLSDNTRQLKQDVSGILDAYTRIVLDDDLAEA